MVSIGYLLSRVLAWNLIVEQFNGTAMNNPAYKIILP